MSGTVSIRIRPPAGQIISLTVDLENTLLSLKETVAPLVRFASAAEVRVVFAGRILRDDEASLGSLGVAEGSTLHVVKLAANTAAASSASPNAPPPVPSSNPYFPVDRQDPLHNAMMDMMSQNPQLMQSLMMADPRLQALAERNPEVRQMLRDPETLQQMIQMMRNPALMREMMRNQDRSLSNIEAIPGGMAALSSLYSSMEQEEHALETRPQTSDESNRLFAERLGVNLNSSPADRPNDSALPNPWGPAPATRPAPRSAPVTAVPVPAPSLNDSFFGDGELSAAELQRIEQMFDALEGTAPAPSVPQATTGQTPSAFPFAPFFGLPPPAASTGAGAGAAGQDPTALLQRLQTELAALSMRAPGAAQGFPYPAPSVPAAAASTTSIAGGAGNTAPAPAPPTESPEERFKDELARMNDMGFTDKAKNIKALLAAGGNVDSAVIYLLDHS
ncbi:hypothetical protein DFJ73DRAFT_844182 [Zopfochytrium polystomum]|nr:hypothetical protein DFJ73DRAFT_844182 [Zopfochytrium polystomum]